MLIRKFYVNISLLSVLLVCCSESKEPKRSDLNDLDFATKEIPNVIIDKCELEYHNKVSLWTLNGEPYSGYVITSHENGIPKEKIGILDGKKENESRIWHKGGNLKQLAHYQNGKLHGEKKVWSSDNVLLSHLSYHLGKPNGEQKTWYRTGELHKKLNLNMGREEGIQQAFRQNGALYANYEAKEGRIFGLKKAALCFGIEDKNVKYAR